MEKLHAACVPSVGVALAVPLPDVVRLRVVVRIQDAQQPVQVHQRVVVVDNWQTNKQA